MAARFFVFALLALAVSSQTLGSLLPLPIGVPLQASWGFRDQSGTCGVPASTSRYCGPSNWYQLPGLLVPGTTCTLNDPYYAPVLMPPFDSLRFGFPRATVQIQLSTRCSSLLQYSVGKYFELDFNPAGSATCPAGSILVTLPDSTEAWTCTLDHVHFHTPWEHRFTELFTPDVEAHFVHKCVSSPSAVIAFVALVALGRSIGPRTGGASPNYLLQQTQDNAFGSDVGTPLEYAKVWNLDTTGGRSISPYQGFFTYNASAQFAFYIGSLTTPPCNPRVNFFISPQPFWVDDTDLEYIKESNSEYVVPFTVPPPSPEWPSPPYVYNGDQVVTDEYSNIRPSRVDWDVQMLGRVPGIVQ